MKLAANEDDGVIVFVEDSLSESEAETVVVPVGESDRDFEVECLKLSDHDTVGVTDRDAETVAEGEWLNVCVRVYSRDSVAEMVSEMGAVKEGVKDLEAVVRREAETEPVHEEDRVGVALFEVLREREPVVLSEVVPEALGVRETDLSAE